MQYCDNYNCDEERLPSLFKVFFFLTEEAFEGKQIVSSGWSHLMPLLDLLKMLFTPKWKLYPSNTNKQKITQSSL